MISIIVPVYNVEKYIVNCLKSIVNQDYADFELLLVNDGSTDDTEKVIKNYLADKKINWEIINKENGGQSSAKNLGFYKSKGEYVVFMDSDDVVTNDFLSSLLKPFQNNTIDFSFCNFKYVKKQTIEIDKNNKSILFNRKELIDSFLRRKINFVLPSMMFSRDFLERNNIYSNENIRFSEDQMFIWDAILHSNNSVYLNKTMYGYFLREKSIMTSSPYEKILKGYDEFVLFSNRVLQEYPNDSQVIKMIVPRWSLGAIYSGANLLGKDEFNSLYNRMNTRRVLWKIINIRDLNSYLLAFVAWLSPSLLYWLCRRLNLSE